MPPSQDIILGIDQGTTNTKVVAVDGDGRNLGVSHAPDRHHGT